MIAAGCVPMVGVRRVEKREDEEQEEHDDEEQEEHDDA